MTTNTSVRLADLVKPKFVPGQTVWYVRRNCNGHVENVQPIKIASVGFAVEIKLDRDGQQVRTETLRYLTRSEMSFEEGSLIASLAELPEGDFVPRY